ncbi:MAG: methyltransferase protein [Sclerophora amabilis]|nr:MAG: methyltransferase protein [Sclerophora amabilis]
MASASSLDDAGPTFYVGQHEGHRPLPVTDMLLRQAQSCGYDMLTTPITTPLFQSRVLTILSSHLAQIQANSSKSSSTKTSSPHALPPPIIPPLTPGDTHLTPSEVTSQLLAISSSWIDLCSPDPLIANISRQVLNLEVAYASFCGIGNVIVPGPRFSHRRNSDNGLTQYARAIQEALQIGTFLSIQVWLPMTDTSTHESEDRETGSLAAFAGRERLEEEFLDAKDSELLGSWDRWNVVRTVCKYNSRLFVALSLPRYLPPNAVQNRWFAEPLRLLSIHSGSFIQNKNGYPVLGKSHQSLITRYMRLRAPPWILLVDVGPIPGLDDPTGYVAFSDGCLSPSMTTDIGTNSPRSPTPAEAAAGAASTTRNQGSGKQRQKDSTPHLSYMRYLQRTQPSRTPIEQFGAGYQDYLQAPLQPLADNLESMTYEVFEKDPVKYDWYERAIAAALNDWAKERKSGSGPDSQIVVAVVGAGRGPLVSRALRASESVGIAINLWAVEKNPNAYVLLLRHNETSWSKQVDVVKSDMRSWQGPHRVSNTGDPPAISHGKVDIIVSELLGSFADNELSPECLDGVQHVLNPQHGISIPSSYTAHLTPVSAPRLHADISSRGIADPAAPETPYVVMLHAIDFLSTTSSSKGFEPLIVQSWEFAHPLNPDILSQASARRGAGISGGGGGQMAGGDGANEHNARFSKLKFPCKWRGECNGLAGYFEAVLWGDIELSTRPDRIEEKSRNMISWFPIYFPLKTPLYFPDDSELDVSIWRQTDDRKVWYEWMVEAFMTSGGREIRVGCSEMHSSRKNGCLM